MSSSNQPVEVVATVTINAAPEAVFKYMINLRHHFLWNPHLRTITPLIRLKEASEYESSSVLLGVKVRGINKVTKLVKNRRLQIENQTGLIHYRVNYSLSSNSQQTKIICNTTIETYQKPLHFAAPILSVLAKRELQSDLQALKVAVEKNIS
jgi:uncharacterized membrane protein